VLDSDTREGKSSARRANVLKRPQHVDQMLFVLFREWPCNSAPTPAHGVVMANIPAGRGEKESELTDGIETESFLELSSFDQQLDLSPFFAAHVLNYI